ncbi:FAD/NAD-P-binding domain-containing protein [Peniophora sp. CONT]|nr:FAD/NAD-P-binding domain-containing protein [Peniophora sp. CONT]
MSTLAKKNIVVVGGSYTGTKAVSALAEKMGSGYKVLLVEKQSHFNHLFGFPRVAVVPGFEHMAFVPYTKAFSALPEGSAEVQVVQARATEVQPDKVVVDRGEAVPYEYLVMATGTKLAPPGTLHTEGKVDGIAYFQEHQRQIKRAKNIVIVGGGAVGVQLTTDIKDYYKDKHVTLVHSRDRLMHKFHPKMGNILAARMAELGVDLITGERVQVPKDGFPTDGSSFPVALSSGRTLSDVDFVILATGQTPLSEPIRALSPGSISEAGFIKVKRTLQLADDRYPRVFAIGDVADTPNQKTARLGFHHTEVITANIAALAAGEEPTAQYEDRGMGIHMSLGMTRDLKFRNPEKEGDEPWVNLSDSGSQDLNMKRIWDSRAPGITDYML